ncbi:MAG: hypothetical protein ABIR32_07715 [Ilumatobacteraceae bacterium]
MRGEKIIEVSAAASTRRHAETIQRRWSRVTMLVVSIAVGSVWLSGAGSDASVVWPGNPVAANAAAGPSGSGANALQASDTIMTSATVGSSAVRSHPVPLAKISSDYVTTDVGCAASRSAGDLEKFFAARLGPIIGFDSPRVYPLGSDRYLWMLQDTFIDYTRTATTMNSATYTNSTALLQIGTCFTQIQRGEPFKAWSVEPGNGESFTHFFWPAGGSVDGNRIKIFWIEVIRDAPTGNPWDGVNVHPASTWLATYDLTSFERLSFEPAPNPGVFPIVGFDAVDGPDGYTYLFGNTFLQNFALEGGFDNKPHSATVMTLARVPRGKLEQAPEFRTATGWSGRAADAVAITSRFDAENIMHPTYINGGWVSATKPNGFLGTTVLVEAAPNPWGPWTTVASVPATPRGDPADVVTYAPIVLPWSTADGGAIVMLSQIDSAWESHNGGDPARYRPRVFLVPL